MRGRRSDPGRGIGDPVEDFEVLDERGRPWRLSEQRGRPLLLIFHRHLR